VRAKEAAQDLFASLVRLMQPWSAGGNAPGARQAHSASAKSGSGALAIFRLLKTGTLVPTSAR